MKKILILTAQYGHGHLTAAKALKEGFEAVLGKEGKVEIVDFVTTFESLMMKAIQKMYHKTIKFTPQIWRVLYRQTDRPWAAKLVNLLSQPFLHTYTAEILKKYDPDIIVSTYPIWNYLVQKVRKSLGKKIPFVSIITDSLNVHTTWFMSEEDAYIVPNEDTAEVLRKKNIPGAKIKVLGFPLRQNGDTSITKTSLDLHEDKKLFLIIFNPDVQILRAKKLLKHLDALDHIDFEILILSGGNEKLRKRLEKKSWRHTIKFHGWIENIFPFLRLSDIVFTKAGGAIVMECIEAEKPMIIFQILPGQEEGNALLIKKHYIGAFLPKNLQQLGKIIDEIFAHYPKIQKNLGALAHPGANIKIAKFLAADFLQLSS